MLAVWFLVLLTKFLFRIFLFLILSFISILSILQELLQGSSTATIIIRFQNLVLLYFLHQILLLTYLLQKKGKLLLQVSMHRKDRQRMQCMFIPASIRVMPLLLQVQEEHLVLKMWRVFCLSVSRMLLLKQSICWTAVKDSATALVLAEPAVHIMLISIKFLLLPNSE